SAHCGLPWQSCDPAGEPCGPRGASLQTPVVKLLHAQAAGRCRESSARLSARQRHAAPTPSQIMFLVRNSCSSLKTCFAVLVESYAFTRVAFRVSRTFAPI